MADESVHERKREADSQFIYHEGPLPAILVRYKADVCLSSIDDAILATRKVFGDEQPDPSPSDIIVSVPTAVGDQEGG